MSAGIRGGLARLVAAARRSELLREVLHGMFWVAMAYGPVLPLWLNARAGRESGRPAGEEYGAAPYRSAHPPARYLPRLPAGHPERLVPGERPPRAQRRLWADVEESLRTGQTALDGKTVPGGQTALDGKTALKGDASP